MKSLFPFIIVTIFVFASCSENPEIATHSTITCPHCGFSKTEELPQDVCLLMYDCTNCGAILTPEGDDCCVFCTYGDHKCPSIQEKENCCASEPTTP